MLRNKVYDYYNEHARRSDPADFWGQVKRTINGKVVGQDQINMIISAILTGLTIHADDFLLDLCCGNGVLSDQIFDRCTGGVGVDFADYLIEIARRNFEGPRRSYILDDVETYVTSASNTERFSAAFCYSSFQYLSPHAARTTLVAIHDRFPRCSAIFLGNLPDRDRIHNFYFEQSYVAGIETNYESAIGMWRTKHEFAKLAHSCGWNIVFRRMPSQFYAAHYRYDAILKRP